MREKEENRKAVGVRAAVFGGFMIAALAFSAGVVSARSHGSADPRGREAAVRTETISADATQAREPGSTSSLNQEVREHRVPGHSELDLQLD